MKPNQITKMQYKKTKLMRVPLEFEEWAKVRQKNINRVVTKINGRITNVPMTRVLKMVTEAQTVELPDYLFNQYTNKRRKRK